MSDKLEVKLTEEQLDALAEQLVDKIIQRGKDYLEQLGQALDESRHKTRS